MKRTLYIGLLTLTAALLLMACSSESYPGLSYEEGVDAENHETPSNDDASGTPVRVFVNEQTFLSLTDATSSRENVMTRGVGSFQDWRKDEDLAGKLSQLSSEERARISQKFNRTNFYLFAFRDKTMEQPNYDAPDFRHYFLVDRESPNSHAPEPKYGDTKDRWHCLVDGQDYHKGLRANLEMKEKEDEENAVSDKFDFKTPFDEKTGERKKIYYPDRGDVGYNFFAYSIGDVSRDDFSTEDQSVNWGQCDRLEDQVVYRNFEVTGSQDIMAGYAPPIEYALNNVPSLTDTEKDQIKTFGYSTFAAHRGVDPIINLHHLMTRIRFRGVAGEEAANHVSIHSIHVKCYNRGDFVVAHRDSTQVGFYPYNTSTDLLGDVYVHDKPELVYDTDGKVIDITPSKIHDTEGLDENGEPLNSREKCWHVDWLKEYNHYEDSARPNKVTSTEDLDSRKKDAVTFGDDLLLPPCDSIHIFVKGYYRYVEKYTENLPDEEMEFGEWPLNSEYVIKAADLVARNRDKEGMYFDDRTKRYIFKPGYRYTINIVVHGTQIVDEYANIDPWHEGDDINVGEDE